MEIEGKVVVGEEGKGVRGGDERNSLMCEGDVDESVYST